jgi:hypothetical protein
MIITALKGGLGNQMFQYALGRTLSLKNNDTLKLDTTGLSRANEVGDIYRPFALNAFAIEASIATPEESLRLKYPYGALSKAWRKFEFKILRRQHVGFEPSMLKKQGDLYLDGYWQSPKYFESIRPTLLKEFTLRTPMSSSAESMTIRMGSPSSVSVHIRRGDYVANPKVAASYGPCTETYYKNAVAEITKHVLSPTWFVFSDDIEWVKEHLSFPGTVIYVSGEAANDQEELLLMAACAHNVIANSSFSWWGAWLNQNPEKIVVAPSPWFDTRPQDHADLLPSSWTRIPKK